MGPWPSSRQYQRAKTSTLVAQSAAPEPSKRNGASLWEGSAMTSRTTEAINARVMTALAINPRMQLSETRPVWWAINVGTSSTTMVVGSSQMGPTMRDDGRAR